MGRAFYRIKKEKRVGQARVAKSREGYSLPGHEYWFRSTLSGKRTIAILLGNQVRHETATTRELRQTKNEKHTPPEPYSAIPQDEELIGTTKE